MVEATAQSSNDDDFPHTTLNGNLNCQLRVGVVLFGRNAQAFYTVGDVRLSKRIKVTENDVGRDAQATGGEIPRIGGDDEVTFFGFFDHVFVKHGATRVNKRCFSFHIALLFGVHFQSLLLEEKVSNALASFDG